MVGRLKPLRFANSGFEMGPLSKTSCSIIEEFTSFSICGFPLNLSTLPLNN
jgi:hypothetical protein